MELDRAGLIVAKESDVHARKVQQEVEQLGLRCDIVDLECLPQQVLSSRLDESGVSVSLSGVNVSLNTNTSVWWRRPHRPRVSAGIHREDMVKFAADEWLHAVVGLLRANTRRVFNDPEIEERCDRKPYQLAKARKFGFRIPRTVITNCPEAASSFIDENSRHGSRTVFKPLTAIDYHLAETRVIDKVDNVASLQLAPAIFQECIELGTDIRCTVVGENVFTCKVHSEHDLIDWRLDPVVQYLPFEIDAGFARQLIDFTKYIGLQMGSYDFRISPGGDIYFFEVNVSGQFLFLEAAVQQPVSKAVADLLVIS